LNTLLKRLAGRLGHEIVAGNFTPHLYPAEHSSEQSLPLTFTDSQWLETVQCLVP